MKYPAGTNIICGDIKGTVIDNFKLAGDICVRWETGQECSYNDWWLDENTEIQPV